MRGNPTFVGSMFNLVARLDELQDCLSMVLDHGITGRPLPQYVLDRVSIAYATALDMHTEAKSQSSGPA